MPHSRNIGWRARPNPAVGAAVMATAIISIGLASTGHAHASAVGLALAGAIWLILAADLGWKACTDATGLIADARTPTALTGPAATAVLGTRISLEGWPAPAAVCLAIAVFTAPPLLYAVLRHERRPVPGAAFLAAVATQGLSVLGITIALAGHGGWLAPAAVVVFGAGIALYGWTLPRFDFGQLSTGAGDQWITAGGAAISALAASKLAVWPPWAGTGHTVFTTAAVVLLGIALGWYAVLVVAEIRRPRLTDDVRRWATVFPLGMCAVATLSTGRALGVGWLAPLGRVLLLVAVIVWVLTAAGQLWAAVRRR